MAEEKKGSWRDIFKTFKYAISPQKILVALIGLIVFNVLNLAFFPPDPNRPADRFILANAGNHLAGAFSIAFGSNGPQSGMNFIGSAKELGQTFLSFIPLDPKNVTFLGIVRVAVFYLIVWLVFAMIVGVITRISAVQVARDENVGIKEALKFAWRKYLSYFAPPALVVIAFLVVGILLNFVLSLLNLIPVAGPTLFALAFPIMIILGLAAVVVMLFGTLGSPLMGPAVGVEGQDTFDALSRAYHYSIQRLGRYVLYMVVMLFFMLISTWFIDAFIIRGISAVTERAATLAGFDNEQKADQSKQDEPVMQGRYNRMASAYVETWPFRANYCVIHFKDKPEKLEGITDDTLRPGYDTIIGEKTLEDGKTKEYTVIRGGSKMFVLDKEADKDYVISKIELQPGEDVGGFILGIWLKGLRYLVGAFAISFFFTGCTIIYFILRKQIDGAELDEVYIEGEDEEFDFDEEAKQVEKEKGSE